MTVLVLAGGVGGAKFASGLAEILPGENLAICVNTGDDFEHLGLPISPDLDTVMYTLAGLNDPVRGWGLEGETWNFIHQVSSLGGDDWFLLGDRDLATHTMRRHLREQGFSLSEVTATLCRALGVGCTVFPMSDDPVRTKIHSDIGLLDFQEYFVREKCQPKAHRIEFQGITQADLSPGLRRALSDPNLEAVILAPSNPFVSIDPILGLPGLRGLLSKIECPVVAISPIVNGQAIKGPAAKMMSELGFEVSASSVASHFKDILDGFVMDHTDPAEGPKVFRSVGHVLAAQTLMKTPEDRMALAAEVMRFIRSIAEIRGGRKNSQTRTNHSVS